MKKIKFGFFASCLIVGGLFLFSNFAQAATPTLSLANSDGDNVTVTVTGADPNFSVLMSFQKSTGGNYLQYIGTTNANGNLSTTISTATYSILPSSPIYVKVNNFQSATVSWPYSLTSGTGAITLNKTGLVMPVGQSSVLTVNNLGSNLLYLLSNSNPQIANINISGTQVTVTGNTYGQTVFTLCVLGTTSNCASAYVTIQNSGAQALTFSQNSLTIAYNQSSAVSILNGNNNSGAYSVLNNSNPSIVSTSISGSTITLTANNNSGTATITVCSTDMSSCGIVTANAGSVTSSGLTFSQTAPTLLIGQSLSINISGGSNCNISSNSNSSVVAANINNSNNTLDLNANGTGSSVITVCSSEGNCNSLTATVGYTSSGGPITLSQNNLWLQVGQSVSVTVSGGNMPYSVLNNTNTNFQATLNNNIITLTGISAGSATTNVCSSGGACVALSVLVNGVSTSQQLTFSNNNLALNTGANTTVTLFGGSGYYISNSNNQNVATFTVNGSTVSVSALSAGSASATVCQAAGQCGVIYAVVTSTDTSSSVPVTFSPNNPTIGVGQSLNVNISGGSGSITSGNYYISSNSNSTIVQANVVANVLSLSGLNSGSAVVVVCASTNSCSSLSVAVQAINPIVPVTPVTTATTTAPVTPAITNNSSVSDATAVKIKNESASIFNGNLTTILNNIKVKRNTKLETSSKTLYLNALIKGLKLTTAQINNLNYFVTYGTASTVKIGVGERAAVLASYLWTYKKLPVTAAQWTDLFDIIFNRLPATLSPTAEAQAKLEFKKIYSRNAVLSSQDNGMIMITAYGLRPESRNLSEEAKAIKLFKKVYNHAPINALALNIVRGIAYSGVTK